MADYVVVDKEQLEADLTIVADSIRAKANVTEQLEFPNGMKQAVESISSGNNSEAEELLVQVIEKEATEIHNDKVTKIGTFVFRNSPIQVADFPNVTELGSYAFTGSSSLVSVNMPKLKSVVKNAFENCDSLKKIDLPQVTTIQAYAFSSSGVITLILRRTGVTSLANVNGLSSYIRNGTGYVYVPQALIESYKTATNWSTVSTQFRALEDYTVDGTITGALDESKI